MKDKWLLPLSVTVLLLVTIGCSLRPRVRSVVVAPALGAFNYANPGDILEFRALDPNTEGFYINFEDPSPCKEKKLLVTKDHPGRCTVLPDIRSFRYSVSQDLKQDVGPEDCPWCNVIVMTRSRGYVSKSNQPAKPSPDAAKAPILTTSITSPITASCYKGVTSVQPAKQRVGDTIFWYPGPLTATMPAGVCKDKTVIHQLEPCILTGPAQKDPYLYTVDAPGCTSTPNNGSLTIVSDPRLYPTQR